MAQTETLPAQNKPVALREHIAKMQTEFAKALPGHITPERFVRTAQTAIALTRNIEKVKNPQSLLAACTKAAADGLILDGREAALVVEYNGDVQYRVMMRGLRKLAFNSGQIKSLVVELVREFDVFDYQPTRVAEPIIHKIDLKATRGNVYAVYAIATLINGGILHEVMTTEEVNRIRERSDAYRAFKAGKIKSTPWHTDWSEMARKTVFRRLAKYLPSSNERDTLQDAVERIDEDYSFEWDQRPESEIAEAVRQRNTKKRGGAAAALKDVTPRKQPEARPVEREPGDETDYDPETGEIIDYADDDQQPGDDI